MLRTESISAILGHYVLPLMLMSWHGAVFIVCLSVLRCAAPHTTVDTFDHGTMHGDGGLCENILVLKDCAAHGSEPKCIMSSS